MAFKHCQLKFFKFPFAWHGFGVEAARRREQTHFYIFHHRLHYRHRYHSEQTFSSVLFQRKRIIQK